MAAIVTGRDRGRSLFVSCRWGEDAGKLGQYGNTVHSKDTGDDAVGHMDGPPPGAVSIRRSEDAWKARKCGQYAKDVCDCQSACPSESLACRLQLQFSGPGWKKKLPYIDEFPLQAASFDRGLRDSDGTRPLRPREVRFAWQDDDSDKNNGPQGNQAIPRMNEAILEVMRGVHEATMIQKHGNPQPFSTTTTADDSNTQFDRGKFRAMIPQLADGSIPVRGGFNIMSHAYKEFLNKDGINACINDTLADASIYEDVANSTKVGAEIRGRIMDPGEKISQLADVGFPVSGGFSTTSHAYKEFLDKGGANRSISDELADESIYEGVDELTRVGQEIHDKFMDPPLVIPKFTYVGVPAPGGLSITSHAYKEFLDKGNEFIKDELADDSIYEGVDELTKVGQEIHDKIMDPSLMIPRLTDAGVSALDGFRTTSHAYQKLSDKGGVNEIFNDKLADDFIYEVADNLMKVGMDIRDKVINTPFQETYLYVMGYDDMKQNVHLVFASLFNRVISYRQDRVLEHEKAQLCAACQRMVQESSVASQALNEPSCYADPPLDEATLIRNRKHMLVDANALFDRGKVDFNATTYAHEELLDKGGINEFINDKLETESSHEDVDKFTAMEKEIRGKSMDPPFQETSEDQVGLNESLNDQPADDYIYEDGDNFKKVGKEIRGKIMDTPSQENFEDKGGVNEFIEDQLAVVPIYEEGDQLTRVGKEIRDKIMDNPCPENLETQLIGYHHRAMAAHFAAEFSTGTNVTGPITDAFTTSAEALGYYIDPNSEEMMIAYPNLPFDRNISDSQGMMFPFLTLAIGNNQGMGDVQRGKINDLYMPPAFLRLYDAPVVNLEDMWRILGKGTLNGGLGAGTTVKPKLCLQPKLFGEACYPFWPVGDFVTNDELQARQVFCQMSECIPEVVQDTRVTIKENGNGKLFSALALAIGNNQGMGDVQCGKIYDLYIPPAFLRLYDAPVVNLEDMWRILGKGTLNGGLGAGTTVKPKLGLQPKPFGEACYAFWLVHDFITNDEQQGRQVLCQMNECIPEVVKDTRVTIKETGNGQLLSANISADDPKEMNALGEYCLSQFRPLLESCTFLVAGYAAGFTAVVCASRVFLKQLLHYHRAGHGLVTNTQTQRGCNAFVHADSEIPTWRST